MSNHAQFIWSIADLLRGSYKAHDYGDVILPFTVLRRLDGVLAPTKDAVVAAAKEAEEKGLPVRPAYLKLKAGHEHSFFNTSPFSLHTLQGDAENVGANLLAYINAFSENVRDIFENFKMEQVVAELERHGLLFQVVQRFGAVDLSPKRVDNIKMGHIFEELIRKFAEASNETAGEHFTPREVIRLMVDLLFAADDDVDLRTQNIVRTVYDPTAGTGGMLSVAEEALKAMNPSAKLRLAGQEINPQSYAICKADMLIKGQDVEDIVFGDTLAADGHEGSTFNFCLSNPPFGSDWKKAEKAIREEHTVRGYGGRFGPGLPRVSDGSMLFLLHLISKMREPGTASRGGRAAIVLNGSPLFTGGAGSGESNIRKWILERDYLEAIIALPTDMFYNTGISTYVWVLSKQKPAERKGKVQLIDGSKMFAKMRKSLGSKRNELGPGDIERIVKLYGAFEDADAKESKVFPVEAFFYRTITVERPLRLNYQASPERIQRALGAKQLAKTDDAGRSALAAALAGVHDGALVASRREFTKALDAAVAASGVALTAPQRKALLDGLSERDPEGERVTVRKGNPEPDTEARDTENVPWDQDIHEYLEREVKPFVPEAWIDETKTKEGCEIPFTRHFYEYVPPRSLEDIDRDLDEVLGRIRARLEQVKA